MYSKKIAPRVTYEVTTMGCDIVSMTEKDFLNNIKCLPFLENMQCFRRYMVDKLYPEKERSYIDQRPCLIVQSVLTEDELRKGGVEESTLENIRRNSAFYPDRMMLSYLNYAEPIPQYNVLFNNKMEILLEPSYTTSPDHISFANADMIKSGLSTFVNRLN